MARQLRTLRAGESELPVSATIASSTKATIPNYGLTIFSTAVGTDFVLAPPEVGIQKVLYNTEATTGVFVRASVAGATDVSFTSTAADTVIEFDGAGDKMVTLMGVSTSRWVIQAIVPATTRIVVGTS